MNYQEIVDMTEERIKTMTMADLDKIFKEATEAEKQLIVYAIKSGNNERIAESLKMVVYRVMQDSLSLPNRSK